MSWKVLAASTVTSVTAIYYLLRYFGGGVCRCKTRLDGLVVVITGANSGIGKALAVLLGQRGATVILACRDIEKGRIAEEEIHALVKNVKFKTVVKHLDLASFSSVIHFYEDLRTEFKQIYALVNNAAIFHHPYEKTVDGFEITYQTNYLGHFLLTHYMLRLLKNSDHGRIVNLSSEAHKLADATDLWNVHNGDCQYRNHFVAYGVSKLALNLFTKALAHKLSNTNIIVNSVNPGNVSTNILRHFPLFQNRLFVALQSPIRFLVFKSPRQGAQSVLHALLTSNRSTGQYYTDCKLSLPSSLSLDDALAKKYYQATEKILDNYINTESNC